MTTSRRLAAGTPSGSGTACASLAVGPRIQPMFCVTGDEGGVVKHVSFGAAARATAAKDAKSVCQTALFDGCTQSRANGVAALAWCGSGDGEGDRGPHSEFVAALRYASARLWLRGVGALCSRRRCRCLTAVLTRSDTRAVAGVVSSCGGTQQRESRCTAPQEPLATSCSCPRWTGALCGVVAAGVLARHRRCACPSPPCLRVCAGRMTPACAASVAKVLCTCGSSQLRAVVQRL
jgi:hypothetical protein